MKIDTLELFRALLIHENYSQGMKQKDHVISFSLPPWRGSYVKPLPYLHSLSLAVHAPGSLSSNTPALTPESFAGATLYGWAHVWTRVPT
jgi:hypothetical protein